MKYILFIGLLTVNLLQLNAQVDINNYAAPEHYKNEASDSAKIMAVLNNSSRIEISKKYKASPTKDLTIPANKTLDFTKGGDLTEYTGAITFEENVHIVNPNNRQIFSNLVTFHGTCNSVAHPEWIGVTEKNDLGERVNTLLTAFKIIHMDAPAYSLQSSIKFPPNSEIKLSKKTYINVDISEADSNLNLFEFNYKPYYIEGGIIQFSHNTRYKNVWAISVQINSNSDTSRWKGTIKDVIIHGNQNGYGPIGAPTANGIRYFLTNPGETTQVNYFDNCDNVYMSMVDTGLYMNSHSSNSSFQKINGTSFNSLTIDRARYGIIIDRYSYGNLFSNLNLQPRRGARKYTEQLISVDGRYNKFYGNFWDACFDGSIWIKSHAANNYFDIYYEEAKDYTINDAPLNTNYWKNRNYWNYNPTTATYYNFDTTSRYRVGTNLSLGSSDPFGVDGNIYLNGYLNFPNNCKIYNTKSILILNGNRFIGFRHGTTLSAYMSSSSFYPNTTLELGLGMPSRRWGALYTENITDDGSKVSISTLINLSPGNPPKKPVEGDIYCNSEDHELYFYNGKEWEQISP